MAVDALGDRLERFDAARGLSTDTIALPASPDDSALWGDLDVDGAGNAYVLDRVNGTVAIVDLGPTGRAMRTVALPARTRRIAVAPDGQALFALDRDGWVRRFAPDGQLLGAFDATRFDVAPSSLPSLTMVGEPGSASWNWAVSVSSWPAMSSR